LNEIPSIDIATAVEDTKELCNIASNNCIVTKTATDVNLKATSSSNEQQSDKQNLNYTLTQSKTKIDSNLKSHQNCPKIRNDDFLWD
jgi:hypothetical protein